MDDSPNQHQPTGDFSDFSDDDATQPELQSRPGYGGAFSTMGSSDMAQFIAIDRNEYSDEDIRIVYGIVVRAETILAEELTPSTRLPTHALFLAYDEIIAENHLDPNERHISKLVFMVGGVKGQKSLMDKFKAVMARMNITLAIEDAQGPGSEHEYRDRDDYYASGDAEDRPTTDDDEYMSNAHSDDAESNGYKSSGGYMADLSMESLDIAEEDHLANKAAAFRNRRHGPFSLVATFRKWHSAAHYVAYVCAQSDAARDADLGDAAIDRFHAWRALAAETERAAPDNVPANAYSKRTERIAIRTNQILSTRKAFARWRQLADHKYRQTRNAQILADQMDMQAYDDDDFKENPQLARLAQRAHRNLVMSRAFTTWSNRVEEEADKAEVAAKAYEMSLKAKALGVSRDAIRQLLASKVSNCPGAPAGPALAPDARQPEPKGPIVTQPTYAASVSSQSRPTVERPLSTLAIPTQFQSRNAVDTQPNSASARPSTAIPIIDISSAPAATTNPASCVRATVPPVEPLVASHLSEDADTSDDDHLDEQTMLARRHILRMRYFGAWQRYTSEHVKKVEQFGEEIQDQRIMQSVSTWRDQAASRRQQASDYKVEFEEARSYRKVAEAIPKWRKQSIEKAHHQQQVLEHYAERAEYYQKTTRALPILRHKTKDAEQKEELLRHYAARINYYLRATQAVSIWRQRAQDVSKDHQLKQDYGERADYYYRTRNTLSTWQQRAKERRKQRFKEAHLETRRIVKKGMGERCIKQWREKLEPSYARYEMMNVALVDAVENRGWQQTSRAFTTWRRQAQERTEAAATSDEVVKQKALNQWRTEAAVRRDMEPEAVEHWEMKTKSRALRTWNLSSLQSTNRPEMAASALERKDRKLLRQGFETWYGRTADKLVPVELPDGTYKNVGQVIKDAQQQGIQNQARGFLGTWRAAAETRARQVQEDAYAPTPGRPHLLLGTFGNRETTTPLAPVPSYSRWQARDSAMGKSEFGARTGRTERTRNPRNLRVSWAA
ncbi:hypothetical protein F4861DRAFT_502940 [Xylaria intraflava]|nr:hypothetical protein F4861DRAFT_502940 [Xylaria intraflava]